MEAIRLGSYLLHVDIEATKEYYKDKETFLCQCADCQNYLILIDSVIKKADGLEPKLGIDLTKNVGVGSDELMAHEYDNHILYVVPYYIFGHIQEGGAGTYQLSDDLALSFNGSNYKQIMDTKSDTFCIWFELTVPRQKMTH